MVGYWDLNENTGTTANDKSGYSNNGILFNFNWNSQSNWTTGKFGTGLKFDGTNDYVSIPDSANLDISSNITIEAWFKATSTGDYQIILMKGGHWNGDPVPPVYGLRLTDTNKFSCLIRIGGTEYANDTTATYTDNNWHHGALTYNGSNVKCYIDGVNYATLSVTGTIDTNNANVTIGLPRNLVDDRFSGTIDEVLIYKRVLSPEEIKAAYNTKINPLYNNFINLVIGAYTYYAYITDLTGANAQTETRTLTIATTTTTTTTTIMPCSGICTLQGSYCCYNGKLYRCQ